MMENTTSVGKNTYLTTGVRGLDDMMGGGYLENTITAIIGESGTGRTTAALQFLAEGARNGEDVMYISFSHDIDRIKAKLITSFPWIESKLDDKFHFLKLDPKNFDSLSYYLGNGLPELLTSLHISRLAIDPMTLYEDSLKFSNGQTPVMSIYHIYWTLKSVSCTTVVVLASSISNPLQSTNGYSEKFADNVLFLVREFPKDTLLHAYRKILLVIKTRYSRHDHYGKAVGFTDEGVMYLDSAKE